MTQRVRRTIARKGYTLWEMAIVLVILAILSGLAVPAFLNAARERQESGVELLSNVIVKARRLAVLHSVSATLVIDPKTGRYRIDTVGAAGYGTAIDDSLGLSVSDRFETEQPRLTFVFRTTGAAFGDTVLVRGTDSTRLVTVDHPSGLAVVRGR